MANFSRVYKEIEREDASLQRNVAPAASETITETEGEADALLYNITTPASGVGIFVLAHPAFSVGRHKSFRIIGDGGGEVKIEWPAGTDLLGDNFGAVGDKASVYSDGTNYLVNSEVTT